MEIRRPKVLFDFSSLCRIKKGSRLMMSDRVEFVVGNIIPKYCCTRLDQGIVEMSVKGWNETAQCKRCQAGERGIKSGLAARSHIQSWSGSVLYQQYTADTSVSRRATYECVAHKCRNLNCQYMSLLFKNRVSVMPVSF